MLPDEVAAELKETGKAAARRFESISVLFADAVGFTARSEQIPADQVVNELDEAFSYFDQLTEKYGCEKIRTIGDAYMVAAGDPVPTADHAKVPAAMGPKILEYCRDRGLAFRVGISSARSRPGRRSEQVPVPRVGRHGEDGEPHGVAAPTRPDRGVGADLPADRRRLHLRPEGTDRGEGEGCRRHLVRRGGEPLPVAGRQR